MLARLGNGFFMNAIADTWANLTLQRRAILIGAVLATLAMVMMVARTAVQPSMALLYGGLDQASAGEVVVALEGMNVPVEVRGDAVYVPADQRDRVRLTLAQQGLPSQGQSGYELLDQLSGFGTTSEMFQANYWRAKEGELARTIVSSAGVKSARVHIAASSRGPFQGDDAPPTASVTVTTRGGALNENVALGIRYMVALSVAGLEPSQVAVIDSRNGVILAPGDEQVGVMADAVAERRSAALRKDLAELLAVRVGPGNVQVSVTVEASKQTERVLERLVDPDSQVTVSSDTQTSSERSKGTNSAITVASNLPDGEAANGGGQDESETQENRETVSFRYSETERSQVLEAGEIKRIGVAVLLNHLPEVDANGDTTFTPRPDEELAAIEELVKSAMAFDADRGDTVTIRTMQFAAPLALGSEAEASVVERFVEDNFGSLIQMIILALVVLALGLFVVRPIMTGKAAEASEETALAAVGTGPDGAPVLLGPDGEPLATVIGEDGQPIAIQGGEQAATLAPPEPPTKEEMEEAERARMQALSDLILARSEESTALLKKWLSDGAPPREAA